MIYTKTDDLKEGMVLSGTVRNVIEDPAIRIPQPLFAFEFVVLSILGSLEESGISLFVSSGVNVAI